MLVILLKLIRNTVIKRTCQAPFFSQILTNKCSFEHAFDCILGPCSFDGTLMQLLRNLTGVSPNNHMIAAFSEVYEGRCRKPSSNLEVIYTLYSGQALIQLYPVENALFIKMTYKRRLFVNQVIIKQEFFKHLLKLQQKRRKCCPSLT